MDPAQTLNNLVERQTRLARRRYGLARNQVLSTLGRIRVRFARSIYPADQMAERFARDARIPEDASLRAVVQENIKAHGADLVELRLGQAIQALCSQGRIGAAARLLRAAMYELASHSTQRAIDIGDAHIEQCPRRLAVRALMKLHSREGNITRAYALLDRNLPDDRHTQLGEKITSEAQLLARGMPLYSRHVRDWSPSSQRKILYHVSQCPPYHNSGYAIRTHSLATQLLAKNWEIEVFARHGYPNDRYDFLERALVGSADLVDSLQYHFVPDREGFRLLTAQEYQERAVATLCKQAVEFRPALIHTASNQIVGLAGTEAARRLGIPSIYEMRGLWHMTRASKQPGYASSEHYAMTQALEIQAADQADHVFAITEAIRDIAMAAGIPAKKITVVPNAVNPDNFVPQEPDRDLKRALGFDNETIIGFVGSFAQYEGLDDLIFAAAKLRDDGVKNFRLLLVGDGAAMDSLVSITADLDLSSLVTFTGRVAHDQVAKYYSLMQICAYPRKGARVCEVVSPLKPFEAMAMEKAIVVSNVKALAEMVQEGQTGLVHQKDDRDSLANSLAELLCNTDLQRQLGHDARAWVQEHRTWDSIADRVDRVYQELLS